VTNALFDPDLPHDAREQLFGGTGRVRVWSVAKRSPRAPFRAVLACELDPGASVGTHLQEHHAEIVIALSGSATASVNGVERALEAGGMVELPLGETLALRNRSPSESFRYLIIKAG
jgi:quercetin dioxygenase-like cupin family protein